MKIKLTMKNWGPAYLLRDDKRMCCLGHLCSRLGVKKEELLSARMPSDLGEIFDDSKMGKLGWLVYLKKRRGAFWMDTRDAQQAAKWNDLYFEDKDSGLDTPKEKRRMKHALKRIKQIFARNGVEIEFGRDVK